MRMANLHLEVVVSTTFKKKQEKTIETESFLNTYLKGQVDKHVHR